MNKIMKLMVIDALDHFGTNSTAETRVIVRFIGEFIEENEEYITLRSKQGNIQDKEDHNNEFYRIVKSTILNQKSVEIEL